MLPAAAVIFDSGLPGDTVSLIDRTKRYLKHHLPRPLFDSIQSIRRLWIRPDPRVKADLVKFKSLNPTSTRERIVMRPGIELNLDPASYEAFQWFCWTSPKMVDEFDALLRLREGRRTMLDLGANHGVFALGFIAGRPDATAIAIDPSLMAFPVLQRNAELNAPDRIRCLQIAAGDQEGVLRMRTNWHHLEVIPDQSAAESQNIKIVPVRPIDAVCEELSYTPDLIKVDVEGFELQAIQGLSRTLRRHRPPMMLEVHPDLIRSMNYTERDIVDLVESLDYRFYDMAGKPLDRSFVQDQINTSWYVCHPREKPPA